MPRIHRLLLRTTIHLRAAYNHLPRYFMAANSKVIYDTTKLFLCVYACSYEEVLNPLGFVMNSIQDNEVAV